MARSFIPGATFYVTPDASAYAVFGLPSSSKATLVVSRESGQEKHVYPSQFDSLADLSAWMKEYKDPLVPQLQASNQNQVFGGKNLVVMALVDPESPDFQLRLLNPMKEAAKKWNAQESVRKVTFVWLDAIQFQAYIARVYRLQSKDLPRLVIANAAVRGFLGKNLSSGIGIL